MLVNCVAYTQGQKVADIPISEIRGYLSDPRCFVWVALKDPDASELERLQEEFGLHELAVEDASHGHQRPKIETSKLHGGRVPPICAGLHDYFRDVYDHLQRLKHATDNLRDMVSTALSVNLSLITLQENEVTKRLAAYAALVAVPTMIAGVYGMNFRHMPELDAAYGYPVAVGVMAVLDLYLVYRFRKAKWL